jgi:hypothetical protein
LLVLAACGGSARPVTDPTDVTPALEPASFMIGDWAYVDGSGVEHWRPIEGAIWGVAFVGDQFEVMVIDDDMPELRFHAMPGGAPETVFVVAETAPSSITFRNPEHDFPTAITYRLDGDELTATLEGRDGPVPAIVMGAAPEQTEAEMASAREAFQIDQRDRVAREPIWSLASPDGSVAATLGRIEGGGSYATIWTRDPTGEWVAAFDHPRR